MLRKIFSTTGLLVAAVVSLQLAINYLRADDAKTPAAKTAALTKENNEAVRALLTKANPQFFTAAKLNEIGTSPCANSLSRLALYGLTNPVVRDTLDQARMGMTQPPPSAAPTTNFWYGAATVEDLVTRMIGQGLTWCTALPTIVGNNDDGLKYIGVMYWFFYQNQAGMRFAHGQSAKPPYDRFPDGFNYFKEFSIETGAFMDSPASAGNVKQWVDDPRVEIQDYKKTKVSEYTSWNDFFTRALKTENKGGKVTIPSRPVTMPDRDYVVSAPTDCIMNPLIQAMNPTTSTSAPPKFIDNPLQADTVLDIKNMPMSVAQILQGVPSAIGQTFVGGTGLSCILMPNTYHHYHAPVSGTVVYAAVVGGPTFGYYDWANLMPSNHNPAQLGTDFTQFEIYQRGVVIIAVGDPAKPIGYVASIPVGLDTIGSVILNKAIIPGSGPAPKVTRGITEIGYFQYGGSMNLLLFSKNLVTASIQTRMGNQIAIINSQ